MKTIISLLMVTGAVFAYGDVSDFSSKYGMICQPTEAYEKISQDCDDSAVLNALDQLNIEGSKEEMEEQLMNIGQVVQNNVLLCKIASIEVSFDDFPQARQAIYKDSTTNRLSGVKVKDLKEEGAIEMAMIQTGFASGTPLNISLRISRTPVEEGGFTYKGWKTKDNGEIEEQTCVIYSQD